MKELFLSELRRFRGAALIAAAVHLLLQLCASRLSEPLTLSWQEHTIILLFYLLCGIGFAVYQFGTYRQPSRWIWLLHRPLPPLRIAAALALASTCLILFAIGLPLLIAVGATDLLSARAVDLRHYAMVLLVVVCCLNAWLAGTYVMLSGRLFAAVAVLLPALLMGRLAAGADLLLPGAICTCLMAGLAVSAFKPERTAPPRRPLVLLAAGLPLQLGLYFVLLWGGSMGFQYGQMLVGEHPLSRPLAPAGGHTELTRADGRSAFLLGLAASKDPRAAHWARQMPLLDIAHLAPMTRQLPVRHQLTNLARPQWTDSERHIAWTFSHDSMRFEGRDLHTGAARGSFGADGALRPFEAVPLMNGPWFMTPQQLVRYDQAARRMQPMLTLAAPERLASVPKEAGNRWYVLTDRRLIVYARPDDAAAQARLLFALPLPGRFPGLERVDIAPLLDGTLLSFNHGRKMAEGEPDARQTVLFVDQAGRAQVIADRPLTHDFAPGFEHKSWWLSPVTHAVLALPALINNGDIGVAGTNEFLDTVGQRRPPEVLAWAAGAALLSALAAWIWLGRAGIPAARRRGWTLAVLLLGPPCLGVLTLLQPRLVRAQVRATSPARASVPVTA
jgi:hypothetical protein